MVHTTMRLDGTAVARLAKSFRGVLVRTVGSTSFFATLISNYRKLFLEINSFLYKRRGAHEWLS